MRNLLLCASLCLAACNNSSTAASGSTDGSSAAAPGAVDGKCGTMPATTASDIDACKAECEKLDDKVATGSRCPSPRATCKANCDQKFKK